MKFILFVFISVFIGMSSCWASYETNPLGDPVGIATCVVKTPKLTVKHIESTCRKSYAAYGVSLGILLNIEMRLEDGKAVAEASFQINE
jgi:hypothetical protein